MKNIVLVGLGPHSKRIYMRYFDSGYFLIKLIVDLSLNKHEVGEYLNKNHYDIGTFFVPDESRDAEFLAEDCQTQLLSEIRRLGITHAIIAAEPKSHFSYLRFFLENGISLLCDKPITAPAHVSTQKIMADKIKHDYDYLKGLYLKAKESTIIRCEVQCQRRWHQGYIFVQNLLKECLAKYQIPITNIDIYHCDGMWNMPDEYLSRENHPYKYGYGKLFHSGYHFVDLMCWLEQLNDHIEIKRPNNVEIYTAITRPSDHLTVLNQQSYHSLFDTDKFRDIFAHMGDYRFDEFGEVDFYGTLQFKRNKNVISTCTLNLLQTGFSRRSWTELPPDTYKANGRVRHERVNIQVGPLLNIQVHSYQSKEINDRNEGDHCDVGDLEHFDIYIFRNIDIIGGKPYEKITMQDLTSDHYESGFIGYNERAREQCVIDFLSSESESQSDLLDHELTISILSNLYKSICNRNDGETPIIEMPLG